MPYYNVQGYSTSCQQIPLLLGCLSQNHVEETMSVPTSKAVFLEGMQNIEIRFYFFKWYVGFPMVLPFFSYFECTLGLKYCRSWLVFEPSCAYVISLYCFYCGKNKWHIRVKSSVVDNAACCSSNWDQAKGMIMFIYAMRISEICSSRCSGIQTQVILWQLITAVIRNLIKYPLILPFSESVSSGGWVGFSISRFTQSHTASKARMILSILWSTRCYSSSTQSSGTNKPAACG